MHTLFCVSMLLVAGQVPANLTERERHPVAPSLPLLTKAEYEKIDTIIERFIQADTGKLKGDAAKRAVDDFRRLGPESIFNLIDGLNRAANMESSCPAVIIAKKVAGVLATTDDMELLAFAKDNIGAAVTAKRHLDVLKDLQFNILLRKNTLQRRANAQGGSAGGKNSVSAMSLSDLEKAAGKERGAQLKAILTEAEKRHGAKAIDVLIKGITNADPAITKLSQGLLAKNLRHQDTGVLKAMLKHERRDVRIAAAGAVGARKLPFGSELIGLLQDGDAEVGQAARRALVQISGGADYGPAAAADTAQRQAALERWREWWSQQK
jgi:HEAT repeat protein